MNIKKTVLVVGSACMFLAATSESSAQEQPWNLGVKAGGSMSWFSGLGKLKPAKNKAGQDMSHESSGRISVSGGLSAGYTLHENVGIGLEVLYAGLGADLSSSVKANTSGNSGNSSSNSDKFRIYSHNLVIPVMVKVYPMGCDPDEGIFYVDLGTQGVLPLAVNVKKSKSNSEDLEKFKDKAGNEFEKSKQVRGVTVDALVGVGYEFPEIGITLEGRYHYGFMNFFKSDKEAKEYREDKMDLSENENIRNHYATVSLGYNFARLLMG
eukprot:CAMPEP_0116823118 /NCGR_PEP_ID=MMETSP0418-20121206/666_1 /TAXON_ID=1158023 /ORGANISM="Astrosyne radiata, Strain 13vi08-1A" /LENGTH=266 /DNA_ID=CAMNT_0004451347 /DNA_START=3297 /DNA_END=4097 /DNA_ORIENTATION=-